VPVKEGSFVIESNTFNEGTTIATVANMKDLIFEGHVDESEVGKIKEGMMLDLNIGALQDEQIQARLEYISPKGVNIDGAIQFEIRAAVKLQDNVFLRAGYSANADIVLDRRENVLAVKERDIYFDDDKIYVDIETGEAQYTKSEIEVGLSDGINIEVISGIGPEQNVKRQ
jgi:HlyD family secretion protein